MGRYLAFKNGVHSIQQLPTILVADGDRIDPRGQKTYELRDVVIEIADPTDVTMLDIGRNWSKKIAVAEFLQLVGGFSEPDTMRRIAPFFNTVTNGGVFHGAYGPRISMQMPRVIERLQVDNATRQAVSVIWDPLHDLMQEDRLDLPCTVDMNFALRRGRLLMSTHMRSNDVWKGWSYDLFQFAQMQCTVANVLGVEPGPYTHFANSLHLYESDEDVALSVKSGAHDQPKLHGISSKSWFGVQDSASCIWHMEHSDPTVTEDWMMEVVESWQDS